MAMVRVSPRGSREVMLARPLGYAMILIQQQHPEEKQARDALFKHRPLAN